MKKIRKKEVSCGIIPVVRSKDGSFRFLLLHQRNGNWSFPKGHIERGETFIETAKREMREEAGFLCNRFYERRMFSLSYKVLRDGRMIDKDNHYFLAFCDTEKQVHIQEEEIQDYCWCSEDEVRERFQFKNIRELFSEILHFLQTNYEKISHTK